MRTFGTCFKELRLERKLTQDELAQQFNQMFNTTFNKSTISQYENNKRKPEVNILENWADYFNVSIDYLLGRTNNRHLSPVDTTKEKTIKQLKLNEKNIEEKKLIDFYKELNDIGKKEALKRVNELTEINKYTTPVTIAAHNDDNTKEQLELMNQDIDEL